MNPTKDTPDKPRRRWLSFSLRGLLVFTVVVAVGIALPMRWRQDDIAQYKVEQQVSTQIDSVDGYSMTYRLPGSDEITWVEYPSYLWKRAMNWGHDADLYEDIESVHLPINKLNRLAPQLKKLRSLTSIDILSSNTGEYGRPLSDEVIEHFAGIDTLEELDLWAVTVTPRQLRRLSSLPNLRRLVLPSSESSIAILDEVSSFHQLESLKVNDVPITRPNVEKLAAIPKLQTLTIDSSAPLSTPDGIQAMAALTRMQWLVIDVPSVDDRWYDALGKMTSLTNLYLKGHRERVAAPGEAFAQLSSLTKLKVLTIDGVSIDDKALETIGKMTSLTELNCDASLTTDAGMKHLAGLPQLREANLSGTRITIHGLHELSKSPTLDYVHLGAGFQVSLQDHRVHLCGTCAFPYDYANTTQFGEANSAAWRNLIRISERNSSEGPSAASEFSPGEDPFAPPTELPDNFADTIGDPFEQPGEELVIE
ncbi:Leucine Rich repeats (2 copies) [Bremerella volcania]|uniref:Leucine Rich repeats (2 copies) n=1 Tax=Bremerella volcania TaxID=2527984 RepID=A0A518CGB6_9BACT|nr:hypothetical protein [Bremerella volcania]QDU78269.1 Leucine Rich repeats (2 copies) [Bremerella volcania]